MRLAVIGLGKLGGPLAALLAASGNEVVGADLNKRVVDLVNSGRAPVAETGLEELMAKAAPHLRATLEVEGAVEEAEVAFCVVPTPSLPDSSFDTSYAEAAFERIGTGFARRSLGHRVAVLTSTVLPGATEARVRPALERGYGKPLGDELGLCYSPEFIALGSVIENMRHPDMLLMGASSTWAADEALAAIRSVAGNDVPVARMSIVDAEMTKIAVNTYVTTKISYANMIAEMCERLPGADAAVVTAAIGLDSRIGHKYLRPAAPYGGPCFPRDNAAFAGLASSLGVTADIAVATDAINKRQVDRLVDRVASVISPGEKVAILGLSYKPSTPVIDESFGMKLASALAERQIRVAAYDPAAVGLARSHLPPSVELSTTAEGALAGSSVVVIATAWPEFAEIDSLDGVRMLYDAWRLVPERAVPSSVELLSPGLGSRAGHRPSPEPA